MSGNFFVTGNIKWFIFAILLCVVAIIVMLIGLYRNNRISNRPTDIPEEEAGNKKQGKKIFIRHAVVAGILLIIAIVLRFTLGGASA